MTDDKQYLDINLEFLDEKFSKKEEPIHNETRKNTSVSKLKLSKSQIKKCLIIGGVVIFFGWVIFSYKNSSTNTNDTESDMSPSINQVPSDSDTVVIGEYTCSRYNYDKAVALNPDESEEQITVIQNSLEYQANELDRLKSEIGSSYVNEYSSQYQIDQYNVAVDEYNSKLVSYNRDAASFSSRVDRYNAQVEAHNNYLKNNCTLNR